MWSFGHKIISIKYHIYVKDIIYAMLVLVHYPFMFEHEEHLADDTFCYESRQSVTQKCCIHILVAGIGSLTCLVIKVARNINHMVFNIFSKKIKYIIFY